MVALTAAALTALLLLPACGDGEGEAAAEGAAEPVVDGQDVAVQAPPPSAGVTQTVFASHILVPFEGAQGTDTERSRAEAESLLTMVADSIASGELDFAEAAGRYSSCPSGQQGGFLGEFGPGQMVPQFEQEAFSLEPGGMSGVFETPYGYHVVLRHPTVSASHVLLAWSGSVPDTTVTRSREEALGLAEAVMDSLDAGMPFEVAASRYSDCPSGTAGGDLGEFARGVMTPAFEEAAFALSPGEVSEVVETPFGYHLIMRTE